MKDSLHRFSSTLALVAPAAALLTANADAALYIKFDGIDGEVTGRGHEKWIEIQSWSWGVTNSGSMSSGGGGGAGKVSLSDFSVMHKIDKASPMLFLHCATGQHIKSAVLSFTRSSGEGNEVEYYKITLRDVIVSSVSGGTPPPNDGQSGDRPTESVSLNFAKIKFEYKPIDDLTGEVGPVVSAEASFSNAR